MEAEASGVSMTSSFKSQPRSCIFIWLEGKGFV